MPTPTSRRGALTTSAVVFIVLLVVTVFAWRGVIDSRNRTLTQERSLQVQQQVDLVERRLNEILLALSAYQPFYRANDSFSEASFATLYQDFIARLITTSLRGVAFSPLTTDATGEHLTVSLAQPESIRSSLLGFDMFGDPARRALVEQARDSNAILASGQLALRLPDVPAGFLIVAPIYRAGATLGSIGERRAAFVGVVSAALQTYEFYGSVLPPDFSSQYRLQVIDASVSSDPIFDSAPTLPDPGPSTELPFTIHVGGRSLELHVHPLTTTADAQTNLLLSALLLGVGTLLSLLLAGTIFALASSRARALGIAREMTADIQRTKERFAELLEALPDPVVLLDKLGRIEQINRAAEETFGYPRDALVGELFTQAELVAPASRSTAVHNLAVDLAGRSHPRYELQVAHQDGTVRTYEVTSRSLREAGETTGMQLLLHDVTERDRLTSQLSKQARELQRVNSFLVGRELKMVELKRQLARQRGTSTTGT